MDDKFEMEVGSSSARVTVSGPGSARVTNQFADLLSPFTELVGLAGDHIRIYRAESVKKRLMRAKEIAQTEGVTVERVHPKNLIPWIENASLEDQDDEILGELWSRLLLSGREKFDSEFAVFTDVLKRLGAGEAKLLTTLFSTFVPYHPDDRDFSGIRTSSNQHALNLSLEKLGVPGVSGSFVATYLTEFNFGSMRLLRYTIGEFEDSHFNRDLRPTVELDTAIAVLTREGLAELFSRERIVEGRQVHLVAIGATLLGERLARRCGLTKAPQNSVDT